MPLGVQISCFAKGTGNMESLKLLNSMMLLLIAGCLSAGSNTPTKSPDVSDNIRKSRRSGNFFVP